MPIIYALTHTNASLIFALPHMEAVSMDVQVMKAHLAINVRDVATSIGFYRDLFRSEPTKVRTGYAKFDVANPPLNFTLNEHAFQDSGALSHLGFQVSSTEEVLALREQWKERGLTTRDEMQTQCCYATQDKSWVKDPDGNEWEVFVVLEDNLPEQEIQRQAACCVSAYCDEDKDATAGAGCRISTSAVAARVSG
jgi:catechol 2,3-dioxygenase-like lactoylglutathione lyase family enzyme